VGWWVGELVVRLTHVDQRGTDVTGRAEDDDGLALALGVGHSVCVAYALRVLNLE
jgi:hypothetical protein